MNTSTEPIASAVAQALTYAYSTPLDPSAPRVLIVGVSGGADSVCLLHALAQVAERWRLQLHVAHLDHNLRPDSPQDAAHVARLAMALGLPLHVQRLPSGAVVRSLGGVEEGARRARYAFLSTLAARLTPQPQQPVVCVAHHANDQAETVLMNLTRGSGLRGLGGMQIMAGCPVDYTGRSVQLFRPLLSVARDEIETYMRIHGLAWREDSSNADQSLVRNRLRHSVVPVLQTINPNVVRTLARTASLLADEARRLDAHDRALLADLRLDAAGHAPPAERTVLDWAALWQLDAAALRGVLRIAVLEIAARDVAASAQDLPLATMDAFVQQVQSQGPRPASGGPHPLWGGVAWSVVGAFGARPAQLSIHRQDVLPFAPDHPYLDRAWRDRAGGQGVPISVGRPLTLTHGWSLQVQQMSACDLPADWKRNVNPWVAYLDAEEAEALHLAAPQAGMRFAPLGLAGKHKSLGDLFTDRKIPVSLRSGWPLIVAGPAPRVLWVCGVQMAHGARITAQTRRVVRLCWRNAESVL